MTGLNDRSGLARWVRRAGWFACGAWGLAVAGGGASLRAAPAAEGMWAAFEAPPATSRPFVRWWWNGGRVNAAEIVREIELLHRAGIGGVEINTIAMEASLQDPDIERHPAVEWLSPAWVELVRVAAEACRERGMTADLIVGSGWPFGARFLRPEEQTQRVLLVKVELNGPEAVRLDVREAVRAHLAATAEKEKRRDEAEPTASRLEFVRLLPADAPAGEFVSGIDLREHVDAGGVLNYQLPSGRYVLHLGMWQAGFTHVKLGAPGADGPVVNHFDAAAVRRYLDAMSAALAPAFPGGMGRAIRATFVDSLELDHANWTADLPQEFERRRGYPLAPVLPFLLDAPAPADERSGFHDTVRRARYDFCRTLTELFEERFIATYGQWARDQGVLARMQAYGREAHPLHGSMAVALPEGETWLWNHRDDHRRIRVESTVANKYVASGANLTGQRLRSFEAMTNAVPVFRATLENFKQGMDLSVLSGVNHPILHGFNYSPPDAGYPGWVRFGSWLNEQNPWWPRFHRFTDYAARLTTVMRHSEAQAGIAILAPRPEEWANHGLLYQPFPEVHVPWYQYRLAEAMHQAGYNADFISERVLEQATFGDGALRFGPRSYRVLVLEEVNAMEPSAAAALARFAEAGGTIVFIGRPPQHAPGRHEAAARDAAVAAAMRAVESAAGRGRALTVAPPAEGMLLDWTARTLAAAGARPDVIFDQPHEDIAQVYHRDGDTLVYFLANRGVDTPVALTATFNDATGPAWLWDPESGTRRALASVSGDARTFALEFAPLESKLIVFDSRAPAGDVASGATATATAAAVADEDAITLHGPWQVEFRVGGSERTFTRELATLGDLSLSEDPEVRDFGGTLVYRTTFSAPGDAGMRVLDLGHVNGTTEVRLNGHPVGVRWWGRHTYDVAGQLQPGANTLEIVVTTVLANQMRSMKDNPTAQRWAWWAPPIAMGLPGPVRLGGKQ